MKILAHSSHVGNTGYNAHSQGFFRALSQKCTLKLRNFTVGPDWRGYNGIQHDCHGKDINNIDRSILHSQTLFDGESRCDYPIYSYDKNFAPDVNIVLNTVDHYYFYDSYIGKKVAYVVWENTLYPQSFFEKLKEYDQVWVPSSWQRKVTIEQGISEHKVKIVHEAVDSSLYHPSNLKWNDDIFRFLVFGAWSDRKSTKDIIRTFTEYFGTNPKVELILSVNNPFINDSYNSTAQRLRAYNLESPNIKVLNFVSREEYIQYLQKGHVLVSCARGEGWNIPLMEAMACGTVSIYSECGGQSEFASGKGVPIKIKGPILASDFPENHGKNSPGFWYEPDFDDLGRKMKDVYNNYEYYKSKALKESAEIISRFTWENAAQSALQHLTELNKLNVLASCSYVGDGGFNALAQNLLPCLNKYHNVKVRNFTIGKNWNGYNKTPHDKDIKEYDKQLLIAQTLLHSDGGRNDYPIYDYKDLNPDINLVINEVDHVYFYDSYSGPKIAYSMYETTEFPQHFLNKIKEYNQFWVPSQWQKENLLKQGFPKDKIKVVPLGVDRRIFNPENKVLFPKFTFGIFGRWDSRKNTKELIQSFKDVFGDNKDVELVLSVDNPYDVDNHKSTIERLRAYNLESHNIKILPFLSREEYIKYIKSIHVFLSCSKGEGWNLPLIEALACGTVCVYSKWSGQLEFCKNIGNPINIVEQSLAKNYDNEQFCKNSPGYYGIPDFKQLRRVMKDIYQNYPIYFEKAQKDALSVLNNFSWERSAQIAAENINDVFMRKLEYAGFTSNKKGIQYKNLSHKELHVKVQIYDTDKKSNVFEDSLVLAPNIQYFSALNDSYSVKDKLIFKISDLGGNVLLEKESEQFCKDASLEYTLTLFNKSFKLPELQFFYEKETNTLRFRSKRGDSDSCIFVARDLYRNLLLSSINNRQPFFIKEGWDYFVFASKDHDLSSGLFTGFTFTGYVNGVPQFFITVPIVEGENRIAKRSFAFHDDSVLELHDNFFAQSIDFYSKDFYKNAILKNDIVLDIGASCGTFVDYCLSRGASKVYAIEPSLSFKVLSRTFADDDHVTVWNGALDIKDGITELTTCSDTTLSSFNMDAQLAADYNKNIKNVTKITVQTKTLQSFLKEYNISKIDVLKMDIEGHEYAIFDSLKNEDFDNISSFILEYHHNKNGLLEEKIIKKLCNAGYEVRRFKLNLEKDTDFQSEKGVVFATKRYYISNESPALGDCVAWINEVERFRIFCKREVCYFTPQKDLFCTAYPNIKFYDYCDKPPKLDKQLGCYDVDGVKWNTLNLQELACRILNIPYNVLSIPKVSLPQNLQNRFNKKYVCIATQSTCQAKYWNNPEGWRKIVNYLKSLGYEVLCVDKEGSYGIEGHMNTAPKGCHVLGNNNSLSQVINDLYFCEFFIGLSSGLSWLAHAVGKKVVLISGYTQPYTEFYSPYRIHNSKVCSGCWNDKNLKFDPSNWLWCPRNKNFECSKEISFEEVKEKINNCVYDLTTS